jgi:hypothetical protein
MARAGLPRAPHEAPYDYLHRIAAERPPYAKELSALVDAFVGLKYADANTRTIELAQFATMVRRFKPAKLA